jgi:hypothetical protein
MSLNKTLNNRNMGAREMNRTFLEGKSEDLRSFLRRGVDGENNTDVDHRYRVQGCGLE